MEQGLVERCHQELQKLLGLLITDVVRSYPSEWTELLPVVEFMLYTMPGAHGYCPRDVDRRWSSALPLERSFSPLKEWNSSRWLIPSRGLLRRTG